MIIQHSIISTDSDFFLTSKPSQLELDTTSLNFITLPFKDVLGGHKEFLSNIPKNQIIDSYFGTFYAFKLPLQIHQSPRETLVLTDPELAQNATQKILSEISDSGLFYAINHESICYSDIYIAEGFHTHQTLIQLQNLSLLSDIYPTRQPLHDVLFLSDNPVLQNEVQKNKVISGYSLKLQFSDSSILEIFSTHYNQLLEHHNRISLILEDFQTAHNAIKPKR